MEKSLRTIPLPAGSMARRKKSHFKQISNVHLETVPADGWASFLELTKLQDSMQFAYIDRVRISYTFDQPDSDSPGHGALFVASMDETLSSTAASNDGQIISADARHGNAGVINLPIKRRITSNQASADQESRTGFPIYLHVRQSDVDEASALYLVIETFGSFFKAESL